MKKYLLAFALLLACHMVFAQNIESLFDEFGKEPHAECVKISPFMMAVGKLFMGNDSEAKLARKFNSMRMLCLEECSDKVKERFGRKLNISNKEGYESLLQMNDDGEKINILMKGKDRQIRELLIVCSGDDDCMLMQLKGKVNKEDLLRLLAEEDPD